MIQGARESFSLPRFASIALSLMTNGEPEPDSSSSSRSSEEGKGARSATTARGLQRQDFKGEQQKRDAVEGSERRNQ